jgi:F-type H+-transporting ATPase subunit delta
VSAERAKVSGLSGRYALALFDLAQDRDLLDQVAGDLAKLRTLVAENEELRRALTSPRASREELTGVVGALAKDMGLDGLTGNFLGTLAANRRLAVLEDVIEDYNSLLAVHKGEMTADVTAAHQLDDSQMEALKAKLREGYGRDVHVNFTVDESLLGGLVVQVGSRQIDSSLKTKLNRLELAMKGAG